MCTITISCRGSDSTSGYTESSTTFTTWLPFRMPVVKLAMPATTLGLPMLIGLTLDWCHDSHVTHHRLSRSSTYVTVSLAIRSLMCTDRSLVVDMSMAIWSTLYIAGLRYASAVSVRSTMAVLWHCHMAVVWTCRVAVLWHCRLAVLWTRCVNRPTSRIGITLSGTYDGLVSPCHRTYVICLTQSSISNLCVMT